MRRVLAVAVCALAACGPPSGECGGSHCATSQRCDWSDGRCVDDLAPVLMVTTPVDASAVTANPLALSGIATDDDGVPKVEYSFDGATWTAVKVGDDGAFAAQMALPLVDGAPLRLTVRATDVRGQVTTRVVGLSVDDVAPACARLSPDDGQVFTRGAVAVRYAAAGYRTLELTIDGASVSPEVAAGEVSLAWPVPLEDWVVHTLKLALTDAAGNTCLVQSTFIVDDVPPALSFESPLDGQVFGPDDYGVAFANGPATDGSGVVDVFVDVDDGLGPIQSGVWGDHWIVGRDPPVGEDYVPHFARAIGVDLAGNSTGIDVTWFADVVAPRLMITSPSPGQKLNASQLQGGDAVISWTVSDGDPQLVVTSPQAPGQNFVLPMNSFGFATSPTDDGTPYVVQLTAATRTGISTGTVGFTVDRVGPSVVSSVPALGSRMVAGPVVVTFSEPMNQQNGPHGTWSADGRTVGVDPPSTGDKKFNALSGYEVDLAGNPIVLPTFGGQYQYRTRPEYWVDSAPDAGLLDMPGAFALSAAADRESVLSFVVSSSTEFNWYVVDAVSGSVQLSWSVSNGGEGVVPQAFAFLVADAGANDSRITAFSSFNDNGGGKESIGSSDQWIADLGGPGWFIESPALPDEDKTVQDDPTGRIQPYQNELVYWRASSFFPAPLTDVVATSSAATHWAFSQAGANGPWAAFGCDAGSCSFLESGNFSDALAPVPYSFAVGAACDLHVFLSSAADGGLALETVPWTAGCPSTGCVAVSTTPVPGTTAAVVFDPRDEKTFELISSSGATFDVSTGTLDSFCAPTLTHVSSFTAPQGLVSAQPVWMYGKPSALYLDGNGTVRLYVSP